MRVSRWAVLPLAVGFANCLLADSILVKSVDRELSAECGPKAEAGTFASCVQALKLHGEGKDDAALDILERGQTTAVRSHFKIARSWPNEAFWKAVATAGATSVGCSKGRFSKILAAQFSYDSDSLASAANDYSKSIFTALYDLLIAIPPDPDTTEAAQKDDLPRIDHDEIANAYRYCFTDPDNFFKQVKETLKPR